jgi:hypothetical protein
VYEPVRQEEDAHQYANQDHHGTHPLRLRRSPASWSPAAAACT